jgi:hypothetical protein
MKKIILLLIFLISAATASAQGNDGWEDWQKTSCYSKISFRLKFVGKNGEQNLWKIQFRSDYPNVISFNYSVTDKLQQYNLTTHRKTMMANQQSDEIEIYTTLEDIFILVDKVSMTPYPEDFVDCDQ